jgi:hypothetical protein
MPKSFSKKPIEININDIMKKDPIPSSIWLPPPEKLGILKFVKYIICYKLYYKLNSNKGEKVKKSQL